MEKKEFIAHIKHDGHDVAVFDITTLEKQGVTGVSQLPFCLKILAENLIQNLDGKIVKEADIQGISTWGESEKSAPEIPFYPGRVLMQDFTGVPAVVDLAAMRSALEKIGRDPRMVNPAIPVDLVIDHSVSVDYYGSKEAMGKNVEKEGQRNSERYTLLKWAQKSFDNVRIVPTGTGICHQVNLEYLSSGASVWLDEKTSEWRACSDTLVGTDSHTTMINGLGIMGWGVGGIEAEAVMMGEPYHMPVPDVVGVRLTGALGRRVNAMDVALFVTNLLRKENVVGKFVEFFGPGAMSLNAFDRATIANMSPEYGATMGFFPTDEKTLDYFRMTGRRDAADFLEKYAKKTGLFMTGEHEARYSKVITLCLEDIPSLTAGPARPEQSVPLADLKPTVSRILKEHRQAGTSKQYEAKTDRGIAKIGDGSILIAAITSCTNTSNPFALVSAGLLAKKCVEKGLSVSPGVKTSFAPGSKVPARYLADMGLLTPLEALGFHIVAFGCTTCIGNSGPLDEAIQSVLKKNDLYGASVSSGNRNFEARIHPETKGNFLTSPALVVAFAVAGRIDIDFKTEPLGMGASGEPVFFDDLFPDADEVNATLAKHNLEDYYKTGYLDVFEGDQVWRNLPEKKGMTFDWDPDSTYIKEPDFFKDFLADPQDIPDIEDAQALLVLGDRITTDHISPAGAIPRDYPAGQYLEEKGVAPADFNSYGSRRGNHSVMLRGTFGNIRIKNAIVDPKEGAYTRFFPGGEEMFVFDAAKKYRQMNRPLIVLAGIGYGTGSSRDWAAKGTALLGIKAVIAGSFERIHRSNLVGMGILPLTFLENQSWRSLGITGSETFSIKGLGDLEPRKELVVSALSEDGGVLEFKATARVDSQVELAYIKHGGILPYVLKKKAGQK